MNRDRLVSNETGILKAHILRLPVLRELDSSKQTCTTYLETFKAYSQEYCLLLMQINYFFFKKKKKNLYVSCPRGLKFCHACDFKSFYNEHPLPEGQSQKGLLGEGLRRIVRVELLLYGVSHTTTGNKIEGFHHRVICMISHLLRRKGPQALQTSAGGGGNVLGFCFSFSV